MENLLRFFFSSTYTFIIFVGISYDEYKMMVRGSLELEWLCHGCEALGQQEPQQALTVLLPMEVEIPGPALDQQRLEPQAPSCSSSNGSGKF